MIYAGYCPSEGKINPLKATNSIFENCKENGLNDYCDDLIQAIEKNQENSQLLPIIMKLKLIKLLIVQVLG